MPDWQHGRLFAPNTSILKEKPVSYYMQGTAIVERMTHSPLASYAFISRQQPVISLAHGSFRIN
jgi:hypothetical protein